jgi:2-polyprenyl-6-methoxyphenol hydroxylase-like FAD-dependent oxidoreductase
MSTSSAQKSLRVLVSGAGISGPVLAYWLGKAGVSVTVVERAKCLRKEGQTVDIEDEGVTIMQWMGVEDAVRQRTTKEVGLKIVDSNNKVCAAFSQSEDGSPTKEFEIVRGELAEVFYESSKDMAEYIFGDTIASMQETETCVEVRFKDHPTREYDIVIVTEGLLSRTRAMAFDEDVRAPVHPLHMYVVSFSFERGKNDDQWARLYNAPRHLALLLRPDGFGRVRANAMLIDKGENTQAIASSRDRTEQKDYFVNIWKDAGWEADRIMEGLREADDLYVQEIAQAKCKTWAKGRVVLVGDTAYCPSPLSGQGTTAAVIGSYILAAEIVQHQGDHHAAFAAYEAAFRPWIEDIQRIMPGAPNIGLPKTEWGIRILHSFLFLLSLAIKSGIFNFLFRIAQFAGVFSFGKKLKLPDPSIFERR